MFNHIWGEELLDSGLLGRGKIQEKLQEYIPLFPGLTKSVHVMVDKVCRSVFKLKSQRTKNLPHMYLLTKRRYSTVGRLKHQTCKLQNVGWMS